jgi:hypothetical protein
VHFDGLGNYLNQLYGVSGTSSSDVWAVGTYANYGEPNGRRHPLALHYNGSAWTSTPVPDAAGGAFLRAVKAISANDVWAVGSKNGYSTPVAYHWTGGAWTEVTMAALPGTGGNNLFYAVAATAPDRVWAIGYQSGTNGPQPLVQRWTGTAWAIESTPTSAAGGALWAGTAVGGTTSTVWCVGYRISSGGDRTLAIRGSGT